ncbi:hypothetical protein OKA05_19690 [Luteolibacter arcticus]|uniref:DUF4019 domain-containing protein n=1 Tax=Luteolibacter arcticus TaxID=1581411 RepID=A0ABT3GMP8_9BACT|nr:hypothetical protein [Luteolibacter arcticus]MCW1924796.1 hypothetical protein [Luteolibacter arcticus]
MKYLWFPLAVAMPFAFSQCEKTANKVASRADMSFAKNTFEALARGDAKARESIDWPTFQAMGQDVGAAYVLIPSETEKANFQQAFVSQFAAGFRQAGGTPDKFENWRVSHHDDLKTEVAADSGGGTVTITVTERDGKERVSGLGFIR